MLSDGFHVRKEVPSAVASPLAAPVFPMTTSKALPPGVPMRTRRGLLHLLAATGAATTLGLYARPARAADGSWDVSYIWAPDLDAVLDYREEVADALGPDVAKDLAVVKGRSGNWGLIYDRSGTDPDAARRVAAAHDRLLRASIGGSQVLATVVKDEGYTRTHNVGYGTLGSLEAAKKRYDRLATLLGPDVHRDLVIECPSSGRWQVVYKRLGDAASTQRVAAGHAKLLARHDIPAEAVPERHLDPVWGAGSGDSERAVTRSGTPVMAVATVAPTTTAAVLSKAVGERGTAAERAPTSKPLPPSSRELPAKIATPLRDAINAHVQTFRKAGVIGADETTSWYVHTLHDDRTWAAINAERSLQCASMVKPYVALAFMHQVKHGRIVYGAVSKAKLEAMIQRSHNGATNWAMKQVGGPAAVQRLLKANYASILRETSIVEYIPYYGRTYKNRSSARDYVRFCRALWEDELPKSAELKRLMGLPGRDRLKTGAPAIPAAVKVMNKTGTTSHLCGDFGILVAKDKAGKDVPYAIVGIIEKRSRAASFSEWQSTRGKVIRSVSNLTYGVLRQHYNLV